jgi:hypothetical protein
VRALALALALLPAAAGAWDAAHLPCAKSTNLALQSEALTDAAWTPQSVTVTPNTATAPDGTLTADTVATLAAGGNLVKTAGVVLSGSAGSASIYARVAAGTQTGTVQLYDLTAGASLCFSSATMTTTWQRISCSAATVSGNAVIVYFYPASFAGSGSAFAWGAQVEVGESATRYKRTTTAAVRGCR